MAKPTSTEEVLAKLRLLDDWHLTPDAFEYLVKILSGANSITAARAAQIIARSRNADFLPHLSSAFTHFLDRPERDKGCLAKDAICRALDALGCWDSDVFLRGIRHVQMEPVFGGREDTAANLRGLCALALTRMAYPDVHFELAALLMDPEIQARRMAVNAVSSLGCERSELLLRMKCLAGDSEPDLLGQCFAGLLAMAAGRSVPFVAGFLSSDDLLVAGQAAAALGQSEDESAFNALRDFRNGNTDLDLARPLILAIGLTRRSEAFHLLLEIVSEGGRSSALAAVEALEIYASDDRRREAIQEAVATRKDPRVSEAFASYAV